MGKNIIKILIDNLKLILIPFVLIFYESTHFGQCRELTLPATKDAQVWNYGPSIDVDRGTDRRDIVIYEWTFNGVPTRKYGLIEFDLSCFPTGTIIDSALISLYHDSGSVDGSHSQGSGSNEFYFYRLTGPWEESVTWNEIPSHTDVNKILVPASESPTQDYIDINITRLVQDMIDNPNSNFGLLMKLRYTGYYRSAVFASSEHPDSNLHPKLKIIGQNQCPEPVSSSCECNGFSITPNLSNEIIVLNLNPALLQKKELTIFNSFGQLVQKIPATAEKIEINISNYADGYYYISIPCKNKKSLKFVVVK